ncbi:hypothetical protein, partial [Bacteroides heparinolyticus]|uniref:hypothetical protein n=2 Tax=Prevotella heparinolytica TaxID=28113 RepID=UPI0035A0264B
EITPKTNSRRTSGRRKFEIRGLVRKNKYSQHVIVNELGVDNYGLADSNNFLLVSNPYMRTPPAFS